MKLEVSKRDAYIMAETLWEAAMDPGHSCKGEQRAGPDMCPHRRSGCVCAEARQAGTGDHPDGAAARRRRAVRSACSKQIEAAKAAEQMEATTDERK